MDYLLLSCSLVAGIFKNLLSKSVNKGGSSFGDMMNVNIYIALVGLTVFAFGNGFTVDGDVLLFLTLALLYGLFTIGSQTFFMFAVDDGEVSVSSIIYSSNFVIPTFFAVIFFGDVINVFKGVGIAVIIVAIILVSQPNGNKNTVRSLIFSVLAMLCSAGVGIIQKVFGRVYGNGQSVVFLFFAFSFMLVVTLLMKAFTFKKERLKAQTRITEKFPMKVVLAAAVVLANKLNLYLAAVLPATVFFPILNGGTVVFSAVLAVLIFKDKITVRKI
ncbi:MAG: EamA family transporter, partial [Clostridia bacterium]|nr:EamA family transporter [Clostridia bacterium]